MNTTRVRMQESNDLVTVNFTSRTEQKIKRLQQICIEEDLRM